jgi:hypothetical protein
LGLVGNIGRPPRPGTSVIHPSIHPIHTLTLHSYPSFSPYLSFLPTRHPTRPSARVGQTTIPFAACAQLSSSALGRTPQRSSFSVPGLNIQVSVTWTYLASCISLSTNRARHSSRSTGWARDGPSRGSAFVLVSKTDPLLPGSHAPAVHPATPKDIISSSPFLSSLAQSSSLRAPADASSGYSGHRQVPASHENGANGNGNHLSSTKADSTSGPISKKPADFENSVDTKGGDREGDRGGHGESERSAVWSRSASDRFGGRVEPRRKRSSWASEISGEGVSITDGPMPVAQSSAIGCEWSSAVTGFGDGMGGRNADASCIGSLRCHSSDGCESCWGSSWWNSVLILTQSGGATDIRSGP